MMDRKTAEKLALDRFNTLELLRDHPEYERVIVPGGIIEKKYGWVFHITSKKCLENGDPRDSLPHGKGPVVVERNGTVTQLGTSRPPKEEIRRFEEWRGYVKPKRDWRIGFENKLRNLKQHWRARVKLITTHLQGDSTRAFSTPSARWKRIEVSVDQDSMRIISRDIEGVALLMNIIKAHAPQAQTHSKHRERQGVAVLDYQLDNLQVRGLDLIKRIIDPFRNEGWEAIDVTGYPDDDYRIYLLRKKIADE